MDNHFVDHTEATIKFASNHFTMSFQPGFFDVENRIEKIKTQIARNRKRSKTPVRVEHIFGFMTNSMNGIFIRSIGMARAKAAIGMKNLTYNLFHLVQLNIELTA